MTIEPLRKIAVAVLLNRQVTYADWIKTYTILHNMHFTANECCACQHIYNRVIRYALQKTKDRFTNETLTKLKHLFCRVASHEDIEDFDILAHAIKHEEPIRA